MLENMTIAQESKLWNVLASRRDFIGLLVLVASLACWPHLVVATPSEADQAEAEDGETLFVRRVWPLFQEKCLACHGNDTKDIKGDLDMRGLDAMLQGGQSGEPSLVPNQPEQSPLFLAVTRNESIWSAMPPKEADRLKPHQINWIKRWIANGAPFPDEARRQEIAKANAEKWNLEDGITVRTQGALSPEWANRRYRSEDLWAYQPVAAPNLPHTSSRSPSARHPIDELMKLSLPENAVLAPRADPRTLIRRVSFDLTGLPPSFEEIETFEHACAQDRELAVKELVDRLLESPHYGERMARHWLDVVRYADSSGFANDYDRGNAWRYRDYVVRCFNSDKPFDRFLREQIAGDELAPNDPEMLIATGFLRMGPWELTGMEVAKIARQRFLDDVTNSVGETFLAHSLQCARCHDHKFDPVPTHDYYAIQACFATTQLAEREAPFLESENTQGFEERRFLQATWEEYQATLFAMDEKLLANAQRWFQESNRDPTLWNEAVAQAQKQSSKPEGRKGNRNFSDVFSLARSILTRKGVPEDDYPPKLVGFEPEDFGRERVARKGLERLRWELDRYEPIAFTVYNGRTPQVTSITAPVRMPGNRMEVGELEKTSILVGGDPFSPSKEVKPGTLSVLGERNLPESVEGRRTSLANWIASGQNPLTSRVIVNRLWLWHFGQAIAGNPNNFGSTGKKPSHPALLDWLAERVVADGWSLKSMHRLIMTTEAYQRSTEFEKGTQSQALSREDAEKSYAVFKPRRLTAEELRDAMLTVTGELNPKLGGIPNRPEINTEVAMQPRQVMGTFAAAWVPNPLPRDRHRRSLYALKIRGSRDPFLEVFNEPAPDFSCEARETSTVTPQVFSLFNGQPSYDRALALAHRALNDKKRDPITNLFRYAFGRLPTDNERSQCEQHWRRMEQVQSRLQFNAPQIDLEIRREAVEENTGEKFSFQEKLHANAEFVPDLQPSDCDARTRALADVGLVLLNTNEFAYIY
jgi:mono/diheme cytochrome c family protein